MSVTASATATHASGRAAGSAAGRPPDPLTCRTCGRPIVATDAGWTHLHAIGEYAGWLCPYPHMTIAHPEQQPDQQPEQQPDQQPPQYQVPAAARPRQITPIPSFFRKDQGQAATGDKEGDSFSAPPPAPPPPASYSHEHIRWAV